MNRFGRRPPRLARIHQAVDAPVWFVTSCTHRRQKWLASDQVHTAFVSFAERAAGDFNVAVGRYIIMPDHVHFFACGDQQFVLANWIGALKQRSPRQRIGQSQLDKLGRKVFSITCSAAMKA